MNPLTVTIGPFTWLPIDARVTLIGAPLLALALLFVIALAGHRRPQ